MQDKHLDKIKEILELTQNDTLKPKEIEQFLTLVLSVIKKTKEEFNKISIENKKTLNDALDYIEKEHSVLNNLIIRKKLKDGKDGLDGINGIDGKDGKDGLDGLSGVDGKNGSPDSGEQIVEKINKLKIEDNLKIDFKHLKNVPDFRNTNLGGVIARNIYQMGDVALTSLINNDVLKWDNTNKRWVNGVDSSGVAWGAITGTLSSQTDLQNALNLKSSTLASVSGLSLTTPDSLYTGTPGVVPEFRNTTEQIRLGYDLLNYVTYTVNSSGNLTIAPTGGLTTYSGSLEASSVKGNSVIGNSLFLWQDGSIEFYSDNGITNIGTIRVASNAVYDFLKLGVGNASLNFFGITNDRVYTFPDATGTFMLTSAIGTTVQEYDADLTTIAGLTATTDNFIVSVASAWASRTPAQVKTTLSLNNVDNTSDANKPISTATQTALDLKAPLISPTFATSITGSYLTASEILITDGSKNMVSAPVATYPSLTELTYVKGVTSSIQTQLGTKQATITFGTGVQTALGINIGSAGAPVLFNGALGTPSSGVGTNLTGTASGLTAGNVTTNANLTGHVTSTGNATILGSFTFAQLNTAVSDADLARTDAANTFTGIQTFSTPIATGSVATMSATVGGGVPTPPNNTTTFLRGDGTFAAPASSVTISEAEIDLGTTPIASATVNVINASITTSSRIIGGVAYEAPTGKDLDEIEMDAIEVKFQPQTGSMDVWIKGLEGYLADKFVIWYTFA